MLNSTQDITTPRPFLLSVASFMAFGLASLCGLMSLGVVVAARELRSHRSGRRGGSGPPLNGRPLPRFRRRH